MKGKLSILLVFVLISCNQQEVDCSNYKVGVFKMYEKGKLVNIIERDSELQLEFIPYTNQIESMSKIIWKNDCEYLLKEVEHTGIEENYLIVNIFKNNLDTISVKSRFKKSSWLIKLLEPFRTNYKFVKMHDSLTNRFYKAKRDINNE